MGLELSGADNLEGSYALPLNRFDTSIGLHGSRLNTSIVEDPLLPLAITSLTKSFGLVLRQPVYQRPNQEVAVSVGFDHSDNQSWLLGEPFNVSPGAVDGQMVVSVLRLSQEWLQRGPKHVLALRSTFNLGLDVWDATENGVPGDPDATFFSWLGQAQYVRRLFNTQNQVILRLTGQCTSDRLLALEQISVGGYNSVRGYIENQLVRDRGLISSIEFRVPVLFDKSGAGMLHLAPFFDFGGGGTTKVRPTRRLSAAPVWVCCSPRASTFPRRFTGAIDFRTSIFPTTQDCKATEWVSRSTCRHSNPLTPMRTHHSNSVTAPERWEPRHSPQAGKMLAWCDAPKDRSAGYPLFAGGSDRKRRCCFQAPLAKQIGAGFLQGIVIRVRLDSVRKAGQRVIPDTRFSIYSRQRSRTRCGDAFLKVSRGVHALDHATRNQVSRPVLGVGDQSHDPLVLHTGGELHTVLRQPQTLDAGAQRAFGGDLHERLYLVFLEQCQFEFCGRRLGLVPEQRGLLLGCLPDVVRRENIESDRAISCSPRPAGEADRRRAGGRGAKFNFDRRRIGGRFRFGSRLRQSARCRRQAGQNDSRKPSNRSKKGAASS